MSQQDIYLQLEGSSKQLHIPVDHCPSGNCEGGGTASGHSVPSLLEAILPLLGRNNTADVGDLKMVEGYGGVASHL